MAPTTQFTPGRPSQRSASVILYCILLATMAIAIGYGLMRAMTNDIGASDSSYRLLLAQGAARDGLAHATEQILAGYSNPTPFAGTTPGSTTITYLDAPYRVPFVSSYAPNQLYRVDSNLPVQDDDVRNENELFSGLIDRMDDARHAWHLQGMLMYDGRGRYIEPDYYNTARVVPSSPPAKPATWPTFATPGGTATNTVWSQAVTPTFFSDLSALPTDAGNRQGGLFLDRYFRRINTGDPLADRAKARYRLRYALGVTDLGGHLLANPKADMNVDWKQANNDSRTPSGASSWLAQAMQGWYNLTTLFPPNPVDTNAGHDHNPAYFPERWGQVFLGRGNALNFDRSPALLNGQPSGMPVTFPMMYRRNGGAYWGFYSNYGEFGVSPPYNTAHVPYYRNLTYPEPTIYSDPPLTPADPTGTGGKPLNPARSEGPGKFGPLNPGTAVAQIEFRPFVSALPGPQLSWFNMYASVLGCANYAHGGGGGSNSDGVGWLDLIAVTMPNIFPTPFGRGVTNTEHLAAPPTQAARKWYEGRTDCPWQVNILTAPPQTIQAMLVGYLPPQVRAFRTPVVESLPTDAQATATIMPANPHGVSSINLTSGGSGYTTPPLVQIFGGGSGATATAAISAGAVTSITLLTAGGGYDPDPTHPTRVIIGPPIPDRRNPYVTPFGQPIDPAALGEGECGHDLFTALSAPGFSEFPVPNGIYGGHGASATAAIDASGAVTLVSVLSGGNGYVGTPRVTFVGGRVSATSASAVGTVTMTGASVSGVTITNPGADYITPPKVVIIGFYNATATAQLSGTGVYAITVTDPGTGYATVPPVTLVGGGGSGATATATIGGGMITGITMDTTGTGYTTTPCVVIGQPNFLERDWRPASQRYPGPLANQSFDGLYAFPDPFMRLDPPTWALDSDGLSRDDMGANMDVALSATSGVPLVSIGRCPYLGLPFFPVLKPPHVIFARDLKTDNGGPTNRDLTSTTPPLDPAFDATNTFNRYSNTYTDVETAPVHHPEFWNSYWWTMMQAMSTTVATARAAWQQYPTVFNPTPFTAFAGAVQHDPTMFDNIEKIDEFFCNQLGENYFTPGDGFPQPPVVCSYQPGAYLYYPAFGQQNFWRSSTAAGVATNTIASLVAKDLLKENNIPSKARAKVMERMLNDLRMSFFGSNPDYQGAFRPLDFDGDGYVQCSCYYQAAVGINGVTANDKIWNTDRVTPAVSISDNLYPGHATLTGRGKPVPDGNWFSLTGCFTVGQSHFYRVTVRGELFDNVLNCAVTQATLDSVLVVDPEKVQGEPYLDVNHNGVFDSGDGYQDLPEPGGVPSSSHDPAISDHTRDHYLYQRWLYDRYTGLLTTHDN